jgi:glycosyltransferase involved in cell wall biosynthesis
MKIDLHVHSKFSTRPSQWILQKLGCPESFTEPLQVYKIAKRRGMSLVTITDHNTLAGCLEIAHLPDVFVSEEVTTYFPEDACKAHVLVYNIDEQAHQDLQKLRENIHDLVAYLQQRAITHALAHPLYAVNDRLTLEHLEQFLLLFKNFELNGARDERQNQILRMVLANLSPAVIQKLVDKHGIEPAFPEPWQKNLTAGSDDHSSLNIARQYLEIEGALSLADYFRGLENDQGEVRGRASTPQTMAHNLYGIAYQFYRNKLNLERLVDKDLILRFLDRFLQTQSEDQHRLITRFYDLWQRRQHHRAQAAEPQGIQELLRYETRKLIWDDPQLMAIVKSGNGETGNAGKKWFRFVNQASNKVLFHFGNHLLDHLSGANFFNIFHSIGSAGALYSLLAPYFVAFSLFTKDRQFGQQVAEHFAGARTSWKKAPKSVKVAHFTDTYYEVNGVAITLQHQVRMALKTNKDLTVITCDGETRTNEKGVQNFKAIGSHDLPEYPELKMFFPPFLEMLNFCFEQNFTHIHSATPGPIGLAALAIARILKLPISGTYHTALPQYARYLTEDSGIEDLVWKYTLWYYAQMDFIYVPSQNTGRELIAKGIDPQKVQIFPRGADIQCFHPDNRQVERFAARYSLAPGLKLLYVGRISKEKNLQLLADVFRLLSHERNDVQLVLVGDGPYMQELRASLQGTPAVFTGYLEGEELARVYASCDVFVFPSTTDTFGNVILEAQAAGLPVIVTNAGGPQENMVPGLTGLVAEANDGGSLLEAIRAILAEPQQLRQMGQAARRYMEDRSFERAFEKTWAMYREEQVESDWVLAEAI